MNIGYQEVKPSAALQPYVDCYWLFNFSGAATEVSPTQSCLPFGMVEIIVQLDDCASEVCVNGTWMPLPKIFMAGMYQEPVFWRAHNNTCKFGIRMKPEMFYLLFNTPSSTVYSNFIVLQNIAGKEADLFAERLVETAGGMPALVAQAEYFLLSQIRKQRPERDYTIEAVKLIRSTRGNISMDDVCRQVYVSPRQLQRSFRTTIGTGPKTYMRIIRFRNAFNQMKQLEQHGGWAGLSYELGYSDQAHFIRDFKEFTGTLPSLIKNTEVTYYGRYSLS